MNAIVNALSAENEREHEADQAETPRLQENLRKLVTKQINLQSLEDACKPGTLRKNTLSKQTLEKYTVWKYNFRFFGQAMFPHNSDETSQRSQVSRIALK